MAEQNQSNRVMPSLKNSAGQEMKNSPSPALGDELSLNPPFNTPHEPEKSEEVQPLKGATMEKIGDSESDLRVFDPPAAKGRIEVVALRAGFIYNSRRVEGERFSISSLDELGDWMKCVDPKIESQHKALMKKARS